MDDLKIVIWIILGLIYLFSRGKKKQPQAPARPRQQEEETVDLPSPQKQLTFEELLKEIEGMKKPPETSPAPQPEPAYVDYDDEIPETKQLEDVSYDYRKQDPIYQQYEDAREKAFLRPSLEETVQLKDTIIRFGQSKGYELIPKSSPAADYMRALRDKESVRKAFVLSEILKTKF